MNNAAATKTPTQKRGSANNSAISDYYTPDFRQIKHRTSRAWIARAIVRNIVKAQK